MQGCRCELDPGAAAAPDAPAAAPDVPAAAPDALAAAPDTPAAAAAATVPVALEDGLGVPQLPPKDEKAQVFVLVPIVPDTPPTKPLRPRQTRGRLFGGLLQVRKRRQEPEQMVCRANPVNLGLGGCVRGVCMGPSVTYRLQHCPITSITGEEKRRVDLFDDEVCERRRFSGGKVQMLDRTKAVSGR